VVVEEEVEDSPDRRNLPQIIKRAIGIIGVRWYSAAH